MWSSLCGIGEGTGEEAAPDQDRIRVIGWQDRGAQAAAGNEARVGHGPVTSPEQLESTPARIRTEIAGRETGLRDLGVDPGTILPESYSITLLK